MILKKPPGRIGAILVSVFFVAMLHNSYAQISDLIPSKSIEINSANPQTVDQNTDLTALRWNILDKLREKDDELMKVPVSIDAKEIVYYENRISILPYKIGSECVKKRGSWLDGLCKSVIRKKFSDKPVVVGLKLLNTLTGDVSIIKAGIIISKNGVSVATPDGYKIEISERANGIKWNLWNTQYKVLFPENLVVVENNYPKKEKITVSRIVKGKKKYETKEVVVGFSYVPYSEIFEQEEFKTLLVAEGKRIDKEIVAEAFKLLRDRKVISRAFPDRLIADVGALSPRYFERIPLLEQGDFTEFQINSAKTVERTLIILGSNGDNAWKNTCNRVSACGWIQFTPTTYSDMRKFYPNAMLEKDFKKGAGDHVNSMMAAILLHDNNLKSLISKFGEKIAEDPDLEEYLAASYNGAPRWVHNSLTANILKTVEDWAVILSPTRKDSKGGLRRETRDFVTKLRYLIKNDLP